MPVLDELALPLAAGFTATLALSVAIAVTKRWHGALSYDTANGPQKFHAAPIPRIGGLAVYTGYWVAASMAPQPVRDLSFAVAAAAVFALASGVVEDMTKNVRVAWRLVAALLSGLVFCLATGQVITRVEIPPIDHALAVPVIAIAFTAFSMACLTHAMNVIDGFNGLATGTAIIMLMAFAGIALRANDGDMAAFCFVAAAVLAGFLLVNFPGGHVFLGDGGAYFLGFVLAAAAVMIPMRNPDVSPWVSIVVPAYPLLEILYSGVRKINRGGKPYQPDGLHLHMLVYRRFGRRIARAAGNERLANPATGALMWGGAAAALIATVLIPHDREWPLVAALALLYALYGAVYRRAAGARALRLPTWNE